MKIETITLTPQEAKEAVQQWLKTKGLDIVVKSFDTKGYPVHAYTVETDVKQDELVTSSPQEATTT